MGDLGVEAVGLAEQAENLHKGVLGNRPGRVCRDVGNGQPVGVGGLQVDHVKAGGPGGNLLEPVRFELGVDGWVDGAALLDYQPVNVLCQVHRVVNQLWRGDDVDVMFTGKLVNGGLFVVPDTGH